LPSSRDSGGKRRHSNGFLLKALSCMQLPINRWRVRRLH
jgi:hypothetical protein